MKPTTEQTMQWAQEAGWMKVLWKDQYADGMDCIKKLATLAYAAGAKAMKERAATVCEGIDADGWEVNMAAIIRALGDDE